MRRKEVPEEVTYQHNQEGAGKVSVVTRQNRELKSTDVFEPRTATGRQLLLFLANSQLLE